MKKLALLFIGLTSIIGCVSAPANTPKYSLEVMMKRTMMGVQTFVDYKVSVTTSLRLDSKESDALALKLQEEAFERADKVCKVSGKGTYAISNSIKKENDEISGSFIVACIDKKNSEEEPQQDQGK